MLSAVITGVASVVAVGFFGAAGVIDEIAVGIAVVLSAVVLIPAARYLELRLFHAQNGLWEERGPTIQALWIKQEQLQELREFLREDPSALDSSIGLRGSLFGSRWMSYHDDLGRVFAENAQAPWEPHDRVVWDRELPDRDSDEAWDAIDVWSAFNDYANEKDKEIGRLVERLSNE